MYFSETVMVCDIKVCRCSLLNEYMNLYEYQRSRSFIDFGPRSLRLTILKPFFSLETAGPIEAKFHVKPPWAGGMKIYSNGPGHMTNMAAMPIYGKNYKKVFSGTEWPMTLNVGIQHRVLKYYQVCSNDNPGLTYFTVRSNLVPYAFIWENGKTMDFSEVILVYDIKVVRCSQLN